MLEFILDLPLLWLSFIISMVLIFLYMNQSKPYSSYKKLDSFHPEKTFNILANVLVLTFLERILFHKRKIPIKEKGTRSTDEEAPIPPSKQLTIFRGGICIVKSTFVHQEIK